MTCRTQIGSARTIGSTYHNVVQASHRDTERAVDDVVAARDDGAPLGCHGAVEATKDRREVGAGLRVALAGDDAEALVDRVVHAHHDVACARDDVRREHAAAALVRRADDDVVRARDVGDALVVTGYEVAASVAVVGRVAANDAHVAEERDRRARWVGSALARRGTGRGTRRCFRATLIGQYCALAHQQRMKENK
jgi:hypothetical protein